MIHLETDYQGKMCFDNNRPTYLLCRAILAKERKGTILNCVPTIDIFKNLYRKVIPPVPECLQSHVKSLLKRPSSCLCNINIILAENSNVFFEVFS